MWGHTQNSLSAVQRHDLPNSQKATQTLGSAPLKTCLRRSPNKAQDEEGEPGSGSAILASRTGYTSRFASPSSSTGFLHDQCCLRNEQL